MSQYHELEAFAARTHSPCSSHNNSSNSSNRSSLRRRGSEQETFQVDAHALMTSRQDGTSNPAAGTGSRPNMTLQYTQMLQENPQWARHARDTVLDLYAAFKIYCLHLVNLETLLVTLIAAGATTLYFVKSQQLPDGKMYGANIQWTIVSFAVISPMIMQIRQAFTRREQALVVLAEVKGLVTNIMLANVLWKWGQHGRNALPKDFNDKTKWILVQMIRDLEALLLLPTLTRGRHRLTNPGRKFVDKWLSLTTNLQFQLVAGVRRLHEQVEVMKQCGLPANEASRINQYHWMLSSRVEKLQNIKFYRTPQATRSFTRLFILVLPVFYGPYYVYLVNPDPHHTLPFVFALCLSVITSLTMIGLFNVEKAMEDPFTSGLDCIHLEEMMAQLEHTLDLIGSPSSSSSSSSSST